MKNTNDLIYWLANNGYQNASNDLINMRTDKDYSKKVNFENDLESLYFSDLITQMFNPKKSDLGENLWFGILERFFIMEENQ
jgi:hypothetical protein